MRLSGVSELGWCELQAPDGSPTSRRSDRMTEEALVDLIGQRELNDGFPVHTIEHGETWLDLSKYSFLLLAGEDGTIQVASPGAVPMRVGAQTLRDIAASLD